MSSLIKHKTLASDIWFSPDNLHVLLTDGRQLTVPLNWFPRLAQASRTALNHWRLIGGGSGIHWPELDEDLSIEGLLKGQ
ncbi:MAG: DUF2442 domain-containing protein [Bacteroidetes bacterium]|nr:DUF2442 domain-containing protein [Bacteroidota bacterium]